jgi:transposase
MSKTTKRAKTNRDMLAFRQALALGWSRERVVEELGISQATYYRWLERVQTTSSEAKVTS